MLYQKAAQSTGEGGEQFLSCTLCQLRARTGARMAPCLNTLRAQHAAAAATIGITGAERGQRMSGAEV